MIRFIYKQPKVVVRVKLVFRTLITFSLYLKVKCVQRQVFAQPNVYYFEVYIQKKRINFALHTKNKKLTLC